MKRSGQEFSRHFLSRSREPHLGGVQTLPFLRNFSVSKTEGPSPASPSQLTPASFPTTTSGITKRCHQRRLLIASDTTSAWGHPHRPLETIFRPVHRAVRSPAALFQRRGIRRKARQLRFRFLTRAPQTTTIRHPHPVEHTTKLPQLGGDQLSVQDTGQSNHRRHKHYFDSSDSA